MGDIDFSVWGPFDSESDTRAACGNLRNIQEEDCSYSGRATEELSIFNAQSGKFYLLLITNYARVNQEITASIGTGTGSLKCPEVGPDSASSHGDPIIHTFKGECYDLNKDGLYLASSHPHWNHDIKVAVYNNFIREFQITSKDDQILFSVNNLNEVTGSWAYGLKHIYRMCTPFNWKECEFSFHEYRFDAQIFMYGVQILFHDYLDPALQKGQRGVHLDIYPRLYEKRKQTFNAEEWDGIYFDNPLPQDLAYCPGNSPRRS